MYRSVAVVTALSVARTGAAAAKSAAHVAFAAKQSLRNDEQERQQQLYTGKIHIRHGAGQQGTAIDFRYPLLGFSLKTTER
jgi:hypothetical protein